MDLLLSDSGRLMSADHGITSGRTDVFPCDADLQAGLAALISALDARLVFEEVLAEQIGGFRAAAS